MKFYDEWVKQFLVGLVLAHTSHFGSFDNFHCKVRIASICIGHQALLHNTATANSKFLEQYVLIDAFYAECFGGQTRV